MAAHTNPPQSETSESEGIPETLRKVYIPECVSQKCDPRTTNLFTFL